MPNSLKADLLLILTTLLAASGWAFSKEIVATMAPLLFISLRFFLAGLILLPFCWSDLRAMNIKTYGKVIGVNLIFAVAVSAWIVALSIVEHMSVGAFIINLSFILVPIVSIFFGERASLFVWLSLPIALVGLACLLLENELSMGVGEMMFFFSALLFAVYFSLNATLAKRMPTLSLVTMQMMVTGVVTLILSTFTETWQFQQTATVWGYFIASLVLASALRFFCQTRGQSMASASHAAVIMTLEPVWVAILAIWLLGETMTHLQLIGCALLFFAVLFSRSEPIWKRLNKTQTVTE